MTRDGGRRISSPWPRPDAKTGPRRFTRRGPVSSLRGSHPPPDRRCAPGPGPGGTPCPWCARRPIGSAGGCAPRSGPAPGPAGTAGGRAAGSPRRTPAPPPLRTPGRGIGRRRSSAPPSGRGPWPRPPRAGAGPPGPRRWDTHNGSWIWS
ncbi:hypothetical protein B5G43_15015 [Flavonifractor sp. An92]|nr:hypothetical protein B5G43_15015 [Flavonifractor sp. An92]